MPRIPAAPLLMLAGLLSGCSPTFNWRDVRVADTGLRATFPCKPDERAREVPMAGRTVNLQVAGCETGGATFAILFGDIGDAAQAGAVLAQWKAASLAQMRGTATRERAFQPSGARQLPESVLVAASGRQPDGRKLESEAAWFARGSRVFQAVIHADRVRPEVAETFFAELRFE